MSTNSTGAPQGTVLAPFLFNLYTTDFQYDSGSCHLQKFSDDSAVVECISYGREEEYRALVDDFVEWVGRYHLLLNMAKTREMVIDFRRKRTASQPLCIWGEDIIMVEDYNYLGIHLGNRLNWKANTDVVYKKGMRRLYFLRKLTSFNVCSKMLEIFYQSVVANVHFTLPDAAWGSSIGAGETNRLSKLIRKASSVIGCKLDSFEAVVERRTLNKLLTIIDNPDHPLHHILESSFSNRLITASPPQGPIQEIIPLPSHGVT